MTHHARTSDGKRMSLQTVIRFAPVNRQRPITYGPPFSSARA